ncbi:MAG: hypothetical protein WBC06_11805 [Chitinophagaceae bacterium]
MVKKIISILVSCLMVLAANAQMEDAVEQNGQAEIDRIQAQWETYQGQIDAMSSSLSLLQNLYNAAQSGVDLFNATQSLDNGECVPDFNLGATALMPSNCVNREGCADCYVDAKQRLKTVRKGMARMRCIYMNTRNFKEKAMSFGDNVAGLHGAMGLTWQAERRKIEKSYVAFEASYDRKYADFIGSLHEALLAINNCETRFGTRDWYQKFGFMFEEIMKEKYKRTD